MSARVQRRAPRGRPLATLALLMAAWIGGRAMLWELPFSQASAFAGALAPLLAQSEQPPVKPAGSPAAAKGWSMADGSTGPYEATQPVDSVLPPLADAPMAWTDNAPPSVPEPLPVRGPQVAASHQLMWLAALARMPVPDILTERMVTPAGPDRARPATHSVEGRWSLDGWALWRQGSGGSLVSQGRVPSYGASQAGAALAYRLAPANRHDPRAYLRLYHALIDQGEGEVAAGLSARPVPQIPVRAYVELRATRFGDDTTRLRPAILAATELPPQELPGGLRGELYLQGGYVGGKFATAFADGQLRVLHDVKRFDLARVSLGGGAWGGAQRGAHRLDLGPTMQADVTLGKTPARISLDWRERVAGNADPDSGLAVTLSTRF